MTTTTLDTKVHDFLAQKRITVAGVSRDNSHHPVGNLIYRRLKKTGHDVVAVNPHVQLDERFTQAVEYCRQHDISVIAGACPMMYGAGVDFGHACMRWILRRTGGLPT